MASGLAALAATGFADPSISRAAIHVDGRTLQQTPVRVIATLGESEFVAGQVPINVRSRFVQVPTATIARLRQCDRIEIVEDGLSLEVFGHPRLVMEGHAWQAPVAVSRPLIAAGATVWLQKQMSAF